MYLFLKNWKNVEALYLYQDIVKEVWTSLALCDLQELFFFWWDVFHPPPKSHTEFLRGHDSWPLSLKIFFFQGGAQCRPGGWTNFFGALMCANNAHPWIKPLEGSSTYAPGNETQRSEKNLATCRHLWFIWNFSLQNIILI